MTAPSRSHGRETWELARTCTDKRRFCNEITARAAAQIECDRGAARKGAMWVYPCRNCRGWHLTNKASGVERRVTSEHLWQPKGTKPNAHLQPPAPKRGDIRIINGIRHRFIERELEGDKWEIIEP